MASTIKLKNSTTEGNAPSSLSQGEVAINVADGNLFYGDGSSVLQNFTFNHVTASGNISSSGTITAATLDAAAVSDTLAAAIVAEIDNDEIPIAKLAEDAVTVTAGTNLSNGGTVTLGGSITLNVDDAFLKNDADDTTSGTITSAGLIATKDTDGGNTTIQIINSNTDGGTDKGAGIEFQHGSANGSLSGNQKAGKILATKANSYQGATANIDSNLEFYTSNNDTDTLQLKIDNLGLATFTGDVSASNFQTTTGGKLFNGANSTQYVEFDSTTEIQISSSAVHMIGHVTASGNISSSGNVIASNFVGAPIQLVNHAWFSNYDSADWGLDLLTNGDDNFGWADRVWDHAVDKSDVPDNGTISTSGTFTHQQFNKGFRINHNITDIELIGTLRPNSSVTELNYYIYKGTPFNGGTGSTIKFLASASSAAAVSSRPNDIYITGSTGLQADKGDYIYVFANADLGSGNIKGSYTLTAKTRE